jgi:hypothetical protein
MVATGADDLVADEDEPAIVTELVIRGSTGRPEH